MALGLLGLALLCPLAHGEAKYRIEIYDRDRACWGNTLFADNSNPDVSEIIEIDMEGQVIWRYLVPGELTNRRRHRDQIVMQVQRLPNSNVLFNVNGAIRLSNGNTVISLRNFNSVIEISPDDSLIWKQEFPLGDIPLEKRLTFPSHPHSPEILPNGNLLLSLTGANLIVEIDRKTGLLVWKWEYPQKGKRSVHIRDASRLANGNTLFVEANAITELASDGRPVWKMVVPGINPSGPKFAYLFKAQRIDSASRAK